MLPSQFNKTTRISAAIVCASSRRAVTLKSPIRHLQAPVTSTATNVGDVDFKMATNIDFENNRPFQQKKLKELVRSLTILKLCSYDGVVNNAERVSTVIMLNFRRGEIYAKIFVEKSFSSGKNIAVGKNFGGEKLWWEKTLHSRKIL